MKKLLNNKLDRPTAVVCYNDQLVLRLMDYLREEGLKIPEDLSFVGYDDSLLSAISEVKLTSVIHPKSRLGLDAAKAIISMIKKNDGIRSNRGGISKLYEPELQIRQSTIRLNKNLAKVE